MGLISGMTYLGPRCGFTFLVSDRFKVASFGRYIRATEPSSTRETILTCWLYRGLSNTGPGPTFFPHKAIEKRNSYNA